MILTVSPVVVARRLTNNKLAALEEAGEMVIEGAADPVRARGAADHRAVPRAA